MTEGDDELKPLGVTCTSTDCDNDLHCFLQKARKQPGQLRRGGPCRSCGTALVQWERVNSRKLDDAAYTFASLKKEMIRHVFWHSVFDERELNHAARKGRILLQQAAKRRLQTSVGRASNPREGRQTPFKGNVLYHAQHAVAACCRKCIEYWHAIPAGTPLSDAETDYLAALMMLYVDDRLPDLAEGPTRIPRVRLP
jgi:hypothetical protein